MIDVIIFSKDESIRNDLSKTFSTENYLIKQVENNKQFNHINLNRFDLIIGFFSSQADWLEFLFMDLGDIPLVVLGKSSTDFYYKDKFPHNLVDIIELPIPGDELINRIKNIIHGLDYYQAKHAIPGPSGKLEDFSFLDIIQNFMRRNYTGTLKLDLGVVKSEIKIYKGKIDSAYSSPNYFGLSALEIVVYFDSGNFEFVIEDFDPQNEIPYDMQKILFHLIEKYSQFENLVPYLPDLEEKLVKNIPHEAEIERSLDDYSMGYLEMFEEGSTILDLLVKPENSAKTELLVIIKDLCQNHYLITEKALIEEKNKKKKNSGGLFKRLFGRAVQEEYFMEEEEDEEPHLKKIKIKLDKEDIDKIKSLIES